MRIVSIALLVFVSGCADRPSPLRTTVALEAPSGAPMPLVPLVSVDVSSHAAIDELEASWNERRALDAFADALEALAAEHPPTEARVLVRAAMLRMALSGQEDQGLKRVFDIAQRLGSLAPGDPDVLYLQGWIPWMLIGARSTTLATRDMRAFIEAGVARWSLLIDKAPTYVGPHRVSAADLSKEVGRLKGMLATLPPEPAPNPTPTSPPPTSPPP